MFKRPKIALALGGGAARGLAHLGVLRILEEERIPIDIIVGTSMGAMIGGLYASDPNAERTILKLTRFLNSRDFQKTRLHQLRKPPDSQEEGWWEAMAGKISRGLALGTTMTRRSFLTEEEVAHYTSSLLDDIAIEDTKIPFGAVATDLKRGRSVTLRHGSILQAVAASSAMPGFFPPVAYNGTELIDGGLVSMVPIREAFNMGAELVVAVNISASLNQDAELVRGYEILFRTSEIAKGELIRIQLALADLVVSPQVGSIHWADFSSWSSCVTLGEKAMIEQLPRLKRLISRRRLRLRTRGKVAVVLPD